MEINLPDIPEGEFRRRWRSAYEAIQHHWASEITTVVSDWKKGVISYARCAEQAGHKISVLDTLLSGARAYEPGAALLLLECAVRMIGAGAKSDSSVIDSRFRLRRGILRSIKPYIMNDQWLSDLLEKHCGLYRNDNNIELCQLPTGSYYIYCEHPVRVEKNLGVDLGICQLFDTADALAKGLSLETMEALNELNPETLLPLYYTGVMSINTYLPIEEHPVNLVFRRENGTTYFTDQESEAEYVAVDILEAPEDFIRLTHQYAIGDADSKVRRLPRERKL